ncbi:hypothetical protein K469DRAFT_693077 [Zopfia rhizophila CBS 207.26]|uniref:Uncharacterized protein n=1 Tax=Zopfia rhizophila CBS 207.26 TaxID=1314779 RepID=A0A6A6EQL4_9PEZI|nr:hypothetical protein K469DRAFT_693077 [Zopfia rhizophila CBS 207.26]
MHGHYQLAPYRRDRTTTFAFYLQCLPQSDSWTQYQWPSDRPSAEQQDSRHLIFPRPQPRRRDRHSLQLTRQSATNSWTTGLPSHKGGITTRYRTSSAPIGAFLGKKLPSPYRMSKQRLLPRLRTSNRSKEITKKVMIYTKTTRCAYCGDRIIGYTKPAGVKYTYKKSPLKSGR